MGSIPPAEKDDFAPTYGSVRENLESDTNSDNITVSTDESNPQNQNLSTFGLCLTLVQIHHEPNAQMCFVLLHWNFYQLYLKSCSC